MNTQSNISNRELNYFLLVSPPIFSIDIHTHDEVFWHISEGTSAITTEYKILEENSIVTSEKIIELRDLNDLKYELKKSLSVKIRAEDNNIIGEISELDIYAFGEIESDVIEEIREDVIDLFEELNNLSKDRLGTLPTKWKSILSQYIQKKS